MSKSKIFYIVTLFLVLNFMSMIAAADQLKLTIDHTKIESTLSDFPVLIHLGTSSGQNAVDTSSVFSTLGNDANRKQISVTTDSGGTQQLYVEIEKWDTTNKQAWLWVKIPSISSTQDTVLYLNYNAGMTENTAHVGDIGSTPGQQVWSNHFVEVNHFAEHGTGVSGEYKDSTGRGNAGQGGGGNVASIPTKSSSLIGESAKFDGVDDYIKVPDNDDLSITTKNQITVSCWWNSYDAKYSKNADGYIHWLGKNRPGQVEWEFVLYPCPPNDPPGVARWYNFNLAGNLGAGANSYNYWKPNEWHYQTGITTCTDSTHGYPDMYMEAADHNGGQSTWQSYGINYQNGNAPLYVGNAKVENTGDNNDWWNGLIDELQISNVARSTAWIKASYYTDKDAMLKITVLSNSNNGTLPVANFNANITTGTVPLSVQFIDLSTNATGWNWDFGDGVISTEQNPAHTYSMVGNYTVSLTVTNASGSNMVTKSDYIKVTVPTSLLVANLSSNTTSGKAPLTVAFTDNSAGSPTSWSWSFGDGKTSIAQNPSHTYKIAGTYTVSLTVKNEIGTNTTTKTNFITVTNPPLIANFSATPTSGTRPINVIFTDTSIGTPTTWSWIFGDGKTSKVQNPTHKYTNKGTYTVSLTVKDAYGTNTTKKSGYISVS